MLFELWFTGLNKDQDSIRNYKQENCGRLSLDDFTPYVETFIRSHYLKPKHLRLYTVIEYNDYDEIKPQKSIGLEKWVVNEEIIKDTTNDDLSYYPRIDQDTYSCICDRFKFNDENIIQNHVRQSIIRTLSNFR